MQHADNPVDWHPWGQEALGKALSDNRLLVISIGYAACHWCHVMESESFVDHDVAAIMNEHFVCVKVDREERPDIDHVYMDAAQWLTGSGGWPLNVIALPDGRPVYAGTYFPKERWMQLLEYFAALHDEQPGLLVRQAENITGEMNRDLSVQLPVGDKEPGMEQLRTIYAAIDGRIDPERGGTLGAPKFPMPVIHDFMLQYHYLTGGGQLPLPVASTLKNMAGGGLYDHLGGGFYRYAVDADWKVPHFEKMLYDNAQLISLYAHAIQVEDHPLYREVVDKTAAFVLREMTSPEGGFYSSLDADSEGEEGRYYTWTRHEVDEILGATSEEFCRFYGITPEGNWEKGKNILHSADKDFPHEMQERIRDARKKLLAQRNNRTRPMTDDKVLTAWNALMLNALLDAYRATQNMEYLEAALKNASFLRENMIMDDGRVLRSYKNGKAAVNGFLDDYAFLASAFMELYQLTFDESWITLSEQLLRYSIKHFLAPDQSRFYYTSSLDPGLYFRPSESLDTVIPSSASVMASNLYHLGRFLGNEEYEKLARTLLDARAEEIFKSPLYHAGWARLMLYLAKEPFEIVAVGKNFHTTLNEIGRLFLPGSIMAGTKKSGTFPLFRYKYIEGKTPVYLCRGKHCLQPFEKAEEAIAFLRENH